MAARKILSALTVLMLITSGMALTAFAAAPSPGSEDGIVLLDGTSLIPSTPSDTVVTDEPSQDSTFDLERTPIDQTGATEYPMAPKDLRAIMDMDYEVDIDLFKNLPVGEDGGGVLIRGDYDHRAPAKILLIDDDDSTNVNTTQQFNNSGVYDMDTGKIMADTLTSLGYDYDVYVVPIARNGPDMATMSQYSTIIWLFGYEWGYYPTLTQLDYWRSISFLEMGGAMWFSGPLFMYSLYGRENYTVGGTTSFDDEDFALKYLGIEEYYTMTGQPEVVNGSSGPVMDGSEQYSTRNWFNDVQGGDQRDLLGAITVPKSDAFEILIADGADTWGKAYDDQPVAVGYDSGTWKTVTTNVDPAVISATLDREDYVDKIMSWLGTPTLNLNRVNIMNMNVTVEDQSPTWTDDWNYVYWGVLRQDQTTGAIFRIFPQIHATVHTHEPFYFTANFENHGAAQNNVPVQILIFDSMGEEMANYSKTTNVGAHTFGSVTDSYTPTRAGFYQIITNVTIVGDQYKNDNLLDSRIIGRVRVAKWLDDLENGTADWYSEGAWKLDTTAAHYNTPNHGWYWQKQGTTDQNGDDLITPSVDLRFYNTSFDHWLYNPDPYFIFFHFLFKGRMRGTGENYVEFLYKASNMTTWAQIDKIDGTTPGANNVPGDFESDWWRYTWGVYMGNFAGQIVQFKFVVKKSGLQDVWWALDDFCVWMAHERNEPPWFIERNPDVEDYYVDVGTSFDLSVYAVDQTGDEPITYQWQEDYVPIPGATSNSTHFDIPRTVPAGNKYERGNTLEISCFVRDDQLANGTLWKVHLLDPRPVPDDGFMNLIEINEDEAKDIDFGTATNIKWFKDIEGQTFTVTAADTTFIDATAKGNNVITFINNQDNWPDWYGWDNITLKVTDSAGSFAEFVVQVHVLPVNDPPKWKVEKLPQGQQGTTYSYTLTATDKDNDLSELTFSDDADFFDITASGEIAFMPTNDQVGYNYFNVTVEDPEGLTATMPLELFISNVNDPPVLRYIPPLEAYEDEPFTFDLSLYVEDPDLLLPPEYRDHITYLDYHPKIVTNQETGLMTWTPKNSDVGEDFFRVAIQDSKGMGAEQEVKITVYNVNDPPVLTQLPKKDINQDVLVRETITAKDDDLLIDDSEEVLTFSNDHTELFTIDPATGAISFTPENDDVGIWTITITVTDSEGESDSMEWIIEVKNVNDAPTIDYIPAQTVTEDEEFTYQVVARDVDMDARKLDGEPVNPNEHLTYSVNVDGATIDSDGLLKFTPTNDQALDVEVVMRITVKDASNKVEGTAEIDVTFTVENVNDPPEGLQIMGLVPNQKIKVDQNIQLSGSATDIDNEADRLIYKWYAGSQIIGQTKDFTWKVKGKGLTEIKLVVADGTDADSLETSYSINVTIEKTEDEPGFEMAFTVLAIAFVGIIAVVARRRRF